MLFVFVFVCLFVCLFVCGKVLSPDYLCCPCAETLGNSSIFLHNSNSLVVALGLPPWSVYSGAVLKLHHFCCMKMQNLKQSLFLSTGSPIMLTLQPTYAMALIQGYYIL